MSDTLRLTEQLLALPSVTPDDQGCQDLIAQRLQAQGFDCEHLVFGPDDASVRNLWALHAAPERSGQRPPLLVFAGHTDVVPTGPLTQWDSPPFVPTYRDGKLFARGASDMKTSLAAMVVAVEQFLAQHPEAPLSIAFLLTSDEEGPALHGTKAVVQWLRERGTVMDYCVVGEPTSVQRTGDMVKNGRRGSLSGKLTVKGIQGHIAYPQLARNPIHDLAPALAEWVSTEWDSGNADFPPTSWQVSNIHAGTGAGNVIPGEVVVDFNFRFSPESTAEALQARVAEVLARHGLDVELTWTLSGQPFWCAPGPLLEAVQAAIVDVTGHSPQLSTSGGTSDGRFIASICPQVIELGPPNATIHQINEHVALSDVELLTACYLRLMQRLAGVHA